MIQYKTLMVIYHKYFSIPSEECIGHTFTVTFFRYLIFQQTFFTCIVFKEIESSWYSVFDLVGSFLEPGKILTVESWQYRWHFTEYDFNRISVGMDLWFVAVQFQFLHRVEKVTTICIILQPGLHNFNSTLWIAYLFAKTFYKLYFISLKFESYQ